MFGVVEGTVSPGQQPPVKRRVADNLNLYKIAYSETVRSLDDQLDELNGMRGRAAQFLAFVGSATGFLVGAGLNATERHAGWGPLVAAGAVLSAVCILAALVVLVPWGKWHSRISGKLFIDGWIETDVPPPSEAHVIRRLTERLDEMQEVNAKILRAIRWAYFVLLVLGSAQVAVWAALVVTQR